jgi:hypothetical protein
MYAYFRMGFLVTHALVVSALALRGACLAIERDAAPALEARAGWTFLGCYTDNVFGRALPNGEAVTGGTNAMTNELCQSACQAAGFTIAGTEYAGECCKGRYFILILLYRHLYSSLTDIFRVRQCHWKWGYSLYEPKFSLLYAL